MDGVLKRAPDRVRRLVAPYLLAAIAVGTATGVNYAIQTAVWPTFPGYAVAYLVAIVFAARAGYIPGLLACFLSFAVGSLLFGANRGWQSIEPPRVVMGIFISVLVSRLQKQSNDLSAAHAALDAVLNAATQNGIVGMDRGGTITLFNAGAEALFGYRAAEVIGVTPFTALLIGETTTRGTETAFHDLVSALDRSHASERDFILARRDGTRLVGHIALTAQRDRGPGAAATGYVAVISDITELRRNEDAMRDAMRAAEAAANSRSAFLATMSHEIRTPLNGIIGMTGLMLETPLLPEQKEFAWTIRTCGETLLTIINDILDFSKIEAGKLSLEEIEFDIYTAIEECAEIVAPSVHYKGLELILPARRSGPPMVRGDQGRVRQIVLNLLSNAVKFTSVGEIVTTVEFEWPDPRTAVVKVAVADTGIGIPSETQDRLFQPFSQADASTTRRYGGTGLGLAISKRLVELMGGEIGVTSVPGHGATFWFTARFGVAEPGLAPGPELAGKRLLVVDDNATNRRVLQLQLERHGCHVRLAQDAEEALALLNQTAPPLVFDAVLTDQCMPGTDGLALTAAIRRRPETKDLPVLLLGSQVESHEQIRSLGVNDVLLKPVRESQLVRALTAILVTRALSAEGERLSPADSPHLSRSGRILVVEDNPVNQRVVVLMLRKLGYSTEVAANGAEALEALALGRYNAILMDCQMPEMDGFEAARAIRARSWDSARTPIVALTANALQGEREKCVAAGMNDYLAKPLTLEMLSDKLREWS